MRIRGSQTSQATRFSGRPLPTRRGPTDQASVKRIQELIRQRQTGVVGRPVRQRDIEASFGKTQTGFSQRNPSDRFTRRQADPRARNANVQKSSPATLSSSTSSTKTPQQTWPIWAVTLVVVSAFVILLLASLVVMLFKWMQKLRHPIHG